jgi:hypothetical protein
VKLSHSVSCGQVYRRIAVPGHGLARPSCTQNSPSTLLIQWETSRCRQPVSSRPHRPRGAPPNISRLKILPHCNLWPEVIPILDSTADTVACGVLTSWISRFGCPQTITIDQERQFELQLFHSLAKFCGIHLSRTTTQHPAANGLVE